MRKLTAAVLTLGAVAALASPASAQFGMDKKAPKNAATPELPHCDRPIGTAAVQEPENKWWTQLGLSNPEALLKLFAARSGCLRIVDRNGGLAMRNQEAAPGSERRPAAQFQPRPRPGRGRRLFHHPRHRQLQLQLGRQCDRRGPPAGLLGSRLGGFGALAGGLSTKKSEAQALITLVDARHHRAALCRRGRLEEDRHLVQRPAAAAAAGAASPARPAAATPTPRSAR